MGEHAAGTPVRSIGKTWDPRSADNADGKVATDDIGSGGAVEVLVKGVVGVDSLRISGEVIGGIDPIDCGEGIGHP